MKHITKKSEAPSRHNNGLEPKKNLPKRSQSFNHIRPKVQTRRRLAPIDEESHSSRAPPKSNTPSGYLSKAVKNMVGWSDSVAEKSESKVKKSYPKPWLCNSVPPPKDRKVKRPKQSKRLEPKFKPIERCIVRSVSSDNIPEVIVRTPSNRRKTSEERFCFDELQELELKASLDVFMSLLIPRKKPGRRVTKRKSFDKLKNWSDVRKLSLMCVVTDRVD